MTDEIQKQHWYDSLVEDAGKIIDSKGNAVPTFAGLTLGEIRTVFDEVDGGLNDLVDDLVPTFTGAYGQVITPTPVVEPSPIIPLAIIGTFILVVVGVTALALSSGAKENPEFIEVHDLNYFDEE